MVSQDCATISLYGKHRNNQLIWVCERTNYQDHPLWRLASQVVLLFGILAFTASDFDLSELKTIGLYLGGAGALEKVFGGKA